MKSKGFTVIELLAVIVILAVISLIATPIVLNIIGKARKSAFLDSAYGIMESAKLYYAESILEGNNTDKTFLFDSDNELKYNGTKPQGGILTLSNKGEIELAIYNNTYCASKSKNDSKITITKYEEKKCIILDSTKNPVIILKGEKEIKLKVGETYNESGVEAKTVDGNSLEYKTVIKKEDEVVDRIDTSIAGTYIITYTAESNGKTSSVIRTVTIEVSNSDTSNASKPVLNGLVPIKWNGTIWIKADENNPEGEYQWYDYNNQMWANGASVTESYRNVTVGTEIPESEILAYFVWIPRYEYRYTDLGSQYAGGKQTEPGEIKVNFISKNVTTPSSDEYKVHPAFTFGEEELSGMWVGKFETTPEPESDCAITPNNSRCKDVNPYIKPNFSSLRYQIVSVQFTTAQKFSLNTNLYGINSAADSHMMKNSEWGAVAYLSQSKYGKYGNRSYSGIEKEIYINNSGSYVTGCSGGSPTSPQSSNCDYTYEQEEGIGASTSGTIYGIYDMNGGTSEYVMGVYRGSDAASIWGATTGSNNAGFSSIPANKYYDVYNQATIQTACNGKLCYGHALSETAGWYKDIESFLSTDSPWLTRGWRSNGTTRAGIFSINSESGGGGLLTFRVVISNG